MHQVGSFLSKQILDLTSAIPGGNHLRRYGQAAKSRYASEFVIAAAIRNHGVAVLFEQLAFGSEDHVFSAGLLIAVVNDDELHLAGSAIDRGTNHESVWTGLSSGGRGVAYSKAVMRDQFAI